MKDFKNKLIIQIILFNLVIFFGNGKALSDFSVDMYLQSNERREMDLLQYFSLPQQGSIDIINSSETKAKDLKQKDKDNEDKLTYAFQQQFNIKEFSENDNLVLQVIKMTHQSLNISKNRVQISGVKLQTTDSFLLMILKLGKESDGSLLPEVFQLEFQSSLPYYAINRCIDNIREDEVLLSISHRVSISQLELIYFSINTDSGNIQLQRQTFINIFIQSMKIFVINDRIFLVSYDNNQNLFLYNVIINPTEIRLALVEQKYLSQQINANKADDYASPQFTPHPLYFILQLTKQLYTYTFIIDISINTYLQYFLNIKTTSDKIETISYFQGENLMFYNSQVDDFQYIYNITSIDFNNQNTTKKISYNYKYLLQSFKPNLSLTKNMIVNIDGGNIISVFSVEQSRFVSYYNLKDINIELVTVIFNRIYIQSTDLLHYYLIDVQLPKFIITNGLNDNQQQQLQLNQNSFGNLYQSQLEINILPKPVPLYFTQKEVFNYYSFDFNSVKINLEEYIIGSNFLSELVSLKATLNISYQVQLLSVSNYYNALLTTPNPIKILSIYALNQDYLFIEYTDKQNNFFVNLFLLISMSGQNQHYIQEAYSNNFQINGSVQRVNKNAIFSVFDKNNKNNQSTTLFMFTKKSEESFKIQSVEIPCNSQLNTFNFDSDEQNNVVVQCGQSLANYRLILNENQKQLNYIRQLLFVDNDLFDANTSTYEIIKNLLYIKTQNQLVIYDYIVNQVVKIIQLPLPVGFKMLMQVVFSSTFLFIGTDPQNQTHMLLYGFDMSSNSEEIYYLRELVDENCTLNSDLIQQTISTRKGKYEFVQLVCQDEDNIYQSVIYRITTSSSQNQIYKKFNIDKTDKTYITQNQLVKISQNLSNFQIAQFSPYHRLSIKYNLISKYESKVENIDINIKITKENVLQSFRVSANFQRNYNATQNTIIQTDQVQKIESNFNTHPCSQIQTDYTLQDQFILTGNRLQWSINNGYVQNILDYQPYKSVNQMVDFVGGVRAQYTNQQLFIGTQTFSFTGTVFYFLLEDKGSLQIQLIDGYKQYTSYVYSSSKDKFIFQQFTLQLRFNIADNSLISADFTLNFTYTQDNLLCDPFYLSQILTVKGLGIIVANFPLESPYYQMLKFENDSQLNLVAIPNIQEYFIVKVDYSTTLNQYLIFTAFGDIVYFRDFNQVKRNRLSATLLLQSIGQSVNLSISLINAILLTEETIFLVYSNSAYIQLILVQTEEELSFNKKQITIFFSEEGFVFYNRIARSQSGDETAILTTKGDEKYILLYYTDSKIVDRPQYTEISAMGVSTVKASYNFYIAFVNDQQIQYFCEGYSYSQQSVFNIISSGIQVIITNQYLSNMQMLLQPYLYNTSISGMCSNQTPDIGSSYLLDCSYIFIIIITLFVQLLS